jgi:hypothetical protein
MAGGVVAGHGTKREFIILLLLLLLLLSVWVGINAQETQK